MKAMRWQVRIRGQDHKVTVRWELMGGAGEVWDDDKLVDSWKSKLGSTKRYQIGTAPILLRWEGIREDKCDLYRGKTRLPGREVVDREEVGADGIPKEWRLSISGQDHDILLTREADGDGPWAPLLDGEPVQAWTADIGSDPRSFTIGESDAVLREEDNRRKLYIGGEFVPGQSLPENVADAQGTPSSEQDGPPRHVIEAYGDGGVEQRDIMTKQERDDSHIMMAVLSALVLASIMGAIGLTNDLTASSGRIMFSWGVATILGISGLIIIGNDESEVGLFGVIGKFKVSGIWSVFVGIIYMALSILSFSVPFLIG